MSELLDQLIALARRIEAEAYQRGRDDAKADILRALDPDLVARQKSPQAPVRPPATDVAEERGDDADDRQRAPKGTARTLVLRAMSVAAPRGIAPADALKVASNDSERMVKASSIRAELRRGLDEGRYANKGGLWFLASSGQESEGAGTPASESPAPWFGDTERR